MSLGNPDIEESFLQTFLRFRTRIARAIGRIVQRDDIEDIVQETFLRCYQASERTVVRHPRSFMLTTARNLALNHIDLADNRLVAGVDSFDEAAIPCSGRRRRKTRPRCRSASCSCAAPCRGCLRNADGHSY